MRAPRMITSRAGVGAAVLVVAAILTACGDAPPPRDESQLPQYENVVYQDFEGSGVFPGDITAFDRGNLTVQYFGESRGNGEFEIRHQADPSLSRTIEVRSGARVVVGEYRIDLIFQDDRGSLVNIGKADG